MQKGLIQLYTGSGKGKTTAAIGQGIRYIGASNNVYMIQFLKGSNSSEINTLKKLEPEFKVFKFEKERDFFWNLSEVEKNELKSEIAAAWNFVKSTLDNKECDMLILDELLGVLENNLIDEKAVINTITSRPSHVEIILTGRKASKNILNIADYVSDINNKKHPYEKGVKARKGIEY